MKRYLAVALCLSQAFVVYGTTSVETPLCNSGIINAIQAYWSAAEVPSDVMDTLSNNGQGTLVYSSLKVPISGLYDNNIKCMYGTFTNSKSTFTPEYYYQESVESISKTSLSYAVQENDGLILEGNGDIKKYIISNLNGVTSFYHCASVGPTDYPSAGIAVAVSKYNNLVSKTHISLQKGLMLLMGISLGKSFLANGCN